MDTDTIMDDILAREGWPAVTNRPSDAGGLTKGGVTFDEYNRWRKLNGKAPIAPTDFDATVTEAEAKAFMLDDIAGGFKDVGVVDADLFALMFDWAETSGPDPVIRALQTALRQAPPGASLPITGTYGPLTAAALVTLDGPSRSRVRDAVARQRISFYVRLALSDPIVRQFRVQNPTSQLENLNGWVNRGLEFV